MLTPSELSEVIFLAIKFFPECFSPGQAVIRALTALEYDKELALVGWDNLMEGLYFQQDPEKAFEQLEELF